MIPYKLFGICKYDYLVFSSLIRVCVTMVVQPCKDLFGDGCLILYVPMIWFDSVYIVYITPEYFDDDNWGNLRLGYEFM